jgi:hypothetical protein
LPRHHFYYSPTEYLTHHDSEFIEKEKKTFARGSQRRMKNHLFVLQFNFVISISNHFFGWLSSKEK